MSEVILGGEAVRAGVATRHELAHNYTKLYRGVFVRKGVEITLRHRAMGAWLSTGRKGVVAGSTAAALLGAPWVDSTLPVELTGVKGKPHEGLILRTERLSNTEITQRAGLPVTTRVRTAFDLGRHLERPDALARLDALMWNQHFDIDDVFALAQRRPHARGVVQLRDLLPLVDGGSESPRESRVRLWLADCGFPRPETQIPVLTEGRRYAYFLDMGWPEYKVAVEYDGDHHRKNRAQYVKDIERLRLLEQLGWIVVRVIAEDRPHAWLTRVETALQRRGCPLAATEMQKFTRALAA